MEMGWGEVKNWIPASAGMTKSAKMTLHFMNLMNFMNSAVSPLRGLDVGLHFFLIHFTTPWLE